MELKAEGISRRYFRKAKGRNVFFAVKETDFTLPEGALTEIVGRSGSGKSTFLNMLAGLLTPTSGRVLLDGTDLYALDDAERSRVRGSSIGVIPQGQTGLQSLTVLENVLLPCTMYGEKGRRERAMELLGSMGIGELAGVYPNELSGGEMRRMAIARAMIREPSILLADEPTGDLDDENTAEVLSLLRKAADGGVSVLLVTHEKEAERYADSVWRMNDGILTRTAGNSLLSGTRQGMNS